MHKKACDFMYGFLQTEKIVAGHRYIPGGCCLSGLDKNAHAAGQQPQLSKDLYYKVIL